MTRYDPVSNDFMVYEPVERPKVELNLPLYETPFDLSSWASYVDEETGTPVVQQNIPTMIRDNTTPIQIISPTPTTSQEQNYSYTASLNNKDKKSALYMMDYLINNKKINPHVAAGILGNLKAESNLNPNLSTVDTNKKTSGGLAMWNGTNFTGLQEAAKKRGISWKDVDFQLDYLVDNLNLNTPQMNDVRTRLSSSTNPHEASEAWAYFERYAGYNYNPKTARQAGWSQKRINEEHTKRSNYAKEIYELWKAKKV